MHQLQAEGTSRHITLSIYKAALLPLYHHLIIHCKTSKDVAIISMVASESFMPKEYAAGSA